MEQVDKLINEFAEQIRKELKNGKRQEDSIQALAALITARTRAGTLKQLNSSTFKTDGRTMTKAVRQAIRDNDEEA